MSKNSIFTGIKLVATSLCLATLCGCGGGGTTSKVYPHPDDPVSKVSLFYAIDDQVDFNDTDIGRQIRQDFTNSVVDMCDPGCPYKELRSVTIDDFLIRVYYGTYNDSIFVTMGGKDVCSIEGILCAAVHASASTIAGVPFVFRYYYPKDEIIVWREGKFYGLWQAYDNGWVTQKDLQEIYEYHQWVFYSDHPSGDYREGLGVGVEFSE